MNRKIAISSQINQIIVGIIEDGVLAEFFLERDNEQRTVGNVYKGRIENVLPGMDAAFVDIGLERNAFLYVDDISKEGKPIDELVRKGETVLVQVTKEPVGSKGARVSTSIALPGRSLVLMPFDNSLGVSRKIREHKERDRLREIASEIKPAKMGVIVRTVAEGHTKKELAQDLAYLKSLWGQIRRKAKKFSPPVNVYQDRDLVYRIVRDLVSEDIDEIIVDQPKLEQKIASIIKEFSLGKHCPVRLYQGKVALFEQLGLFREIERALQNRVWLDSGGYLIIDETEALVSIDVNTGKYIGTRHLQETVLKTNKEAAQEIAKQLRLRNIGGIIIVDFIDMDSAKDRQAVVDVLEEALAKDKTKSHVLGFTRLGLVEITRKKAKKRLSETLGSSCECCGGSGRVLSEETLALQIAHQVYAIAQESEVEAILVQCHPGVASFLIGNGGANLASLEKSTGMKIFVRGHDSFDRDQREIHSGTLAIIEKRALPVKAGQKVSLVVEGVHHHNPVNGIGKIEGFVIDIIQGKDFVGKRVEVEILQVGKTFAQGNVLRVLD